MVDTPGGHRRRAFLRHAGAAASAIVPTTVLAGCLSTSDTRSMTFIHGEATADATVRDPANSPDVDEYVLQEGGVHWDTRPVDTVVGTTTIPDNLGQAAARDAISAALRAWNDVPDVTPLFAAPTFDDGLTAATHGNGTNELVWASLGDAVARATIHWNPDTEHIQEVDVELDTDRDWTTTPETVNAFDVQSLATHELGHHGLDDLTDPSAAEQTMYHASRTGSARKRTLEAGDVAGWQAAYRR